VRATSQEYEKIDLRAHSLLAGVPIHDVWAEDLPGGGPDRTIVDLRALVSVENLSEINAAVRFLFRLRGWLGVLFGWDSESGNDPPGSFLEKLSPADRENSLVAPGTREGRFRVLYVSPREAISEIQNATVHAFSVFVLVESATGYRFYWSIYVQPVGRITSWYMRLIDPFRRFIVYPAVLRHVRAAWSRAYANSPSDVRP
jgi:hypothetical protein